GSPESWSSSAVAAADHGLLVEFSTKNGQPIFGRTWTTLPMRSQQNSPRRPTAPWSGMRMTSLPPSNGWTPPTSRRYLPSFVPRFGTSRWRWAARNRTDPSRSYLHRGVAIRHSPLPNDGAHLDNAPRRTTNQQPEKMGIHDGRG